ncbi:MAG: hypothetical protein KIT09_00445 [Bryobacteraceae bacterium]|nr:hypothetical protein [Bryobacteraceae bacterium]
MITLFLAAHVLLWKRGVGFAWPALPEVATRWAALVVIATGVALFAVRVGSRRYREQNSPQELLWPPLILAPCITGYVCSNFSLSATTYQWLFLFHALSANLVMAIIPFTKVARAVLGPLTRFAAHIDLESSEAGGERRFVWVLHTEEEEEEEEEATAASGRRAG